MSDSQPPFIHCVCGRRAPVTPSASPRAFTWQCVCGRAGDVTWPDALDAPTFEPCAHTYESRCQTCGALAPLPGLGQQHAGPAPAHEHEHAHEDAKHLDAVATTGGKATVETTHHRRSKSKA